jgi:pSer/pThr/pTyr-binding forkhead associated (FHA) protein
VHLGAIQGLAIQDSVNADSDTVLKTRMLRDRLKMLQGDDVSRMLGRGPIHVNPPSPFGQAETQPTQQQTGVAVAERPIESRAPAPSSPLAIPADDATIVRPSTNGFKRGVLMVRTGPSAGMRYEINAPRIIVGRRSPDTNVDVPMVQIDDVRVSRHHLEIFAKPDGLYVRDLGSANGTWINGRQVRGEPVRLEDGAEILVGPDSTLNYRMN